MWSCSHKKCFIKSSEFRHFHTLPHFQRSRSNCKTKYNFHFSNCFRYLDNNPLQWMTVWSRVFMDVVKWKTFSLEILRNCQSIILIKIVFSFSSIFFSNTAVWSAAIRPVCVSDWSLLAALSISSWIGKP